MSLLNSISEKQFVFILGAPRSGTTWLQAMLAHHPSVAATPEIEQTFFDRYLVKLTKAWAVECRNREEGKWVQGLPYLWSEAEFDGFVKDFFQKVYVKILEKNPAATHILDKHPNYSNHVALIHKVAPKAKYVHIIRDGRNVAVSMISASRRLGFGPGDVGVAAQKWLEHTIHARKAEAYGADSYYEVKYEDLVAHGKNRLLDIFAFCNLPVDEKLIETIDEKKLYSSPNPEGNAAERRGQTVWSAALSQHQKYLFNKIAGNLLKSLHYVDDDSWVFPSNVARLKLFASIYPKEFMRRLKRAGSVLLNGSG